MDTGLRNWQGVREEVLRRIHARVWAPGDLLPTETELAAEFGCARTTVNRALRTLAESGLLDRRRKAGTRVVRHPVRKATLSIPVIRLEIEKQNKSYGYALLSREMETPPADVLARMCLRKGSGLLHLQSLHLADGQPYAFEDRWINTAALPESLDADLESMSANEWLVMNAPFTNGDIAFSAVNATDQEAELLGTQSGVALFVVERSTWNGNVAITSVKLVCAPGYRMRTDI
ncbi:MAG: GntR family transcriptional regulator [Alphaproteobacteria bacterium]|jgi:GntR family histidine utilization transcriptional repressor|nr:GntR family transcriptional regulator [Alphaproteobacteria bacterium]HJP20608.1 GntR family transcriptional regulator [Alphaproteobacteria bacterium]